jgi:hypothetical protein
LEFRGLYAGHVEYQVIGAKHLPVAVHDYRRSGTEALRHARATGDLSRFAAVFCAVAQMKMSKNLDDNRLLIELFGVDQEAVGQSALHTLWVAAGFDGKLPQRRYLYYYAEPTDDGRCVLIALYAQPRKDAHHFLRPRLQVASISGASVK